MCSWLPSLWTQKKWKSLQLERIKMQWDNSASVNICSCPYQTNIGVWKRLDFFWGVATQKEQIPVREQIFSLLNQGTISEVLCVLTAKLSAELPVLLLPEWNVLHVIEELSIHAVFKGQYVTSGVGSLPVHFFVLGPYWKMVEKHHCSITWLEVISVFRIDVDQNSSELQQNLPWQWRRRETCSQGPSWCKDPGGTRSSGGGATKIVWTEQLSPAG